MQPVTPLALVVSLPVTAGVILLGAAVFRVQVDLLRVLLSCLAATAAQYLFFLVAQPGSWTALRGALPAVVLQVIVLVVGMALQLFVLVACMVLIAEAPVRLGWSLSDLGAGGGFVAAGLFVLGRGGAGSKPAAWVLVAVGALLLLGGYVLGARGGHPITEEGAASPPAPETLTAPSPVPVARSAPAATGGFGQTIGPVTAAAAGPPPREREVPTTGGFNPTVFHGDNATPVATGWLVLSVGQEKGKKFELRQGDVKIGRSRECAIRVVGDEEVSREHALVRVSGPRYQLFDLASRNGTFLSGAPVREPRVLQDGDQIQIGNSVLTFKKVE